MNEITLMMPRQLRRTGIRKGVLADLALKILYLQGEMSLHELSEHICLGTGVVEEIFQFLRKEQLCEVKGMSIGSHRIAASVMGKHRGADLLSINQYAGPAPVSLSDYSARVGMQSVKHSKVQPSDLIRAVYPLVLDQEVLLRLGTAVVSGASIFLYGPAGTGKTSLATRIPEIYNDSVWVPYAVEIDGQIIAVYDPGVHKAAPMSSAPNDSDLEESDKRWVMCRRPCVVAGGELSAEMLDLQFNAVTRFYTAPLQMKANNGVLLLDDFGRQRMRPEELLNRWMTPLDRGIDFLTLTGGKKFELPFDLFVVFSTNLDPLQLADDAFLRRIPNKIHLDYASRDQFLEIFRSECQLRMLPFDPEAAEYLADYITDEMKQPFCQCFARDLINQIAWTANYQGLEPQLTREVLEQACRAYFLPPALD
jgi:MoxR-like ATPase